MKNFLLVIITLTFFLSSCNKQRNQTSTTMEVKKEKKNLNTINLPQKTVFMKNIVYKTINKTKLTLDLYLPNKNVKNAPLLVWTHGGAWMRGSKEAFITKNNHLVNTLLNEGYAIASIKYRLSHEAIFPAQIQDCNDAINFLYENSTNYAINKDKIASIGRSAGAHLASLVATSNSHNISNFFTQPSHPKFKIKALVNFFGPSDLIAMRGKGHDEDDAPEAKLLGGSPIKFPKLAKIASPTTYINSNTPPTILLHGLNDNIVPSSQSEIFKTKLDALSITNEIYLVEGARHGDRKFDSDLYVKKVLSFLRKNFPVK